MTDDEYNPTYPFKVHDSSRGLHAWLVRDKQTIGLQHERIREGKLDQQDRAYISFRDDTFKANKGHHIALGVTNGVPFLQACKRGKCHVVDLFELLDVLVTKHPGIVLDVNENITGIYSEE